MPVALMTLNALAPEAYSGLMSLMANWQEEFAGMGLWLQGAWSDSSTNNLMLTAATRVTVPSRLPGEIPRFKTLYQRDTSTPTGFGPFTSGSLFPYTHYSQK